MAKLISPYLIGLKIHVCRKIPLSPFDNRKSPLVKGDLEGFSAAFTALTGPWGPLLVSLPVERGVGGYLHQLDNVAVRIRDKGDLLAGAPCEWSAIRFYVHRAEVFESSV
jgi:hypothetical protein